MQIIYKKLDDLIPYINNPRNNKNAIDKVASSIKNFGFKVPIVIDKNNEIITGHTRLEASKKLNLKEVPCIIAEDLTETQIKAYRIADNKVAEFSEWDDDMLNLELEELRELDIDLEILGFSEFEINDLLNREELNINNFFEESESKNKDKKEQDIKCPYCNMYFKV